VRLSILGRAVFVLLPACVSRDLSSADDRGGTSDVGASWEDGDDDHGSGPAQGDVGVSTTVDDGDAGGFADYPDCRGGPFGVWPHPSECEGASFGFALASDYDAYACDACLCHEPCEHDRDCTDPGAVARPACQLVGNDKYTCFLMCDRDSDCPVGMACIMTRLEFTACFWPLPKACCTWPDPGACCEAPPC
jgi:hypothetical protein